MTDLELALDAALAAGRATLEWFGDDPAVRHKGPDQPVTAADLRADDILYDRLVGARPQYGWLSEEVPDRRRPEADRVWVVDPIDGTRSFIRGYREYSISIALVEGEGAVLGVVYNPASREVCWAERGAGARAIDDWTGGPDGARPLETGAGAGDDATRPALLASRSEIRRGEFEPFADGWRIVPLGSTAYKLAGVATGKGDAYISRGPKSSWDVAAGVLIVEEAGARVTDVRGEAVRYGADPYVHGIVAGARADVHAALLARASVLPSERFEGHGRDRGRA